MKLIDELTRLVDENHRLGKIQERDFSNLANERFGLWPHFDAADMLAVMQVMESGRVNRWTGNQNVAFEKEFAEYCGSKYAISVFNGTVALELALQAFDIGEGDEVITTCRTFIASASCIVMRGATPIIADVDPVSQNITVETISPLVNEKTRAIICVHHAGWPCEMDKICEFAKKHKLKVIEDCAQAHGAEYKGKKVGNWGDIAAFSFCQDKIMTTGGEGGVILTDNEDLYYKMWAYKDHGKSYQAVYEREHPLGFRWLHESFGTNFRMLEMQAALGRVALRKLPEWLEKREKYAEIYNTKFAGLTGIRLTIPESDIKHAYYKYYCFVKPEKLKPDWDLYRIIENINAKGIPAYSGSCWNITAEKAFTDKGWELGADKLPIAEVLRETSLMLLLHPTLEEEDIIQAADIVCEIIKEAQL